ncbi:MULTISPECIES: DUF1428 domain-containing protein [Sphingomonas]|jgi:uncharacterized protein YbaA (DUF1428 family)|uniref:DUF1428 domain-containing protein n=1 Tax=Sphingomonas TaxID=13687 RepID=UPI001AEA39DF
MPYIDGFVIPVPTDQKQAFIDHATIVDAMFLELGATRIVECWGDDVPVGKLTDFARAVAATPDETVAFSWIEWPDKGTRDAAFDTMRDDLRMRDTPIPFDGKRMIFGGFAPVLDLTA